MIYALVSFGLLLGATEARLKFGKLSPPRPLKALFDEQPAKERTTTEEDYQKQWADFLKDNEKNYLSQTQHDERYEIFKDNIDKINTHNAKKLSWQMGVTPFADLTEEEFKEQIVGGCTLAERKNDDNVIYFDEETMASNPTSVNWVTEGKITPVKNQGQCGSCWAFSTTGAIEGRVAIKTGVLTSLSEQELVDCAGSEGNNGCRGGLMDYGFEYVEKEGGLCTEEDFPYDAKTEIRQCNVMRSKCQHYDPISSHVDVKQDSSDDLETALAQGPVSVAIEADQSAFQLYRSGVLTGRCGTKLDHGVLAVGYSNEGSQHYWIVKNSWGSNWGENGYIRLCKDCGVNRGAGQCGILGQPSYPIAK